MLFPVGCHKIPGFRPGAKGEKAQVFGGFVFLNAEAAGKGNAILPGHQGQGSINAAEFYDLWGNILAFQKPDCQLPQARLLLQKKKTVVFQVFQVDPGVCSPRLFLGQQFIVAIFGRTQNDFFLGDALTAKPILSRPFGFGHGKKCQIQGTCLKLLLQQQPVARDLRIISSALKMISDMERIGDQAADIAEIVKYMADREIPNAQHLKNMSEFAMGMLSSSINAFVEQNADKARKVILDDDVVDSYFERVKADLIESLTQSEADKEAGQFLLDILMIAKYIERVGDHATNIAEWVVYGLTGAHPEETN